jgi:hypothetical protein
MKPIKSSLKYLFSFCLILSSIINYGQGRPWAYVDLSTEMIEAHAKNQKTDYLVDIFKAADMNVLAAQISTDELRLTFWINIYNGYIMHILRNNPKKYEDRRSFFSEKQINIAGKMMSFSDIEHGILRRSQHPLKLGYGKRWFVSKLEKKLRMSTRDYRIHFALNCGAKSCPPVRPYRYIDINQQLNESAVQYLTKSTSCSEKKCEVTTLFSWFRGDFGGTDMIDDILIKYKVIADNGVKRSIDFADYDWTLDIDNFYKE